ncbi:MAG: helix-turn-helix transcriptional regulator [Leptothrix sp. (in: b-proteobacteria)]
MTKDAKMETRPLPNTVRPLAASLASPSVPSAVTVPTTPEQAQRIKRSERFLRMDELEYRLAKKKSAVYAMIKRGEFPAPIRISARCVAWPESWVDAYIEKLISTASASQTKPLPGMPGADICTAGDTP